MEYDYNFNGQLIAVVGKGRSGKNTVARMIREMRPHAVEVAFADKIKKICRDVYDFSDDQLYGDARDKPDTRYPRPHNWHHSISAENGSLVTCARCGREVGGRLEDLHPSALEELCSYLTAREALQELGTRWGRACYPPTWIMCAFREASVLLDSVQIVPKPHEAVGGTSGPGSSVIRRCDLVVVTDCRFVNEAKAVRAANGRVWRVVRPGAGLTGAAAQHVSETDQDRPEMAELVERQFSNTGTLEELRVQVEEALRGLS